VTLSNWAGAGIRPRNGGEIDFRSDACDPGARQVGGPSEGEVMAKVNAVKFFQEVRQEINKVTWPTRRETMITTGMVFVMSFLAALFFLFSDQIIRYVVTLALGIGS
jgi:preprotein translocase subunit SecE